MVAQTGDYLAWWEVPAAIAIVVIWVWGGARLLHRVLREHLPRRQAGRDRCVRISALAGLAGGVAGAVFLALAYVAGKRVGIAVLWPSIAASGAVFLLISYVILYASLPFGAGRTLGTWLRAFGPPALAMALIGTPVAWAAHQKRLRMLDRRHSVAHLRELHWVLLQHYRLRDPPADLQRLLDDNIVPPERLRCRTETPRKISFFYLPARLLTRETVTTKLLACDYRENLAGNGRAVVFTNGTAKWCSNEEFDKLVEQPDNRVFGVALRQAEKPPQKR